MEGNGPIAQRGHYADAKTANAKTPLTEAVENVYESGQRLVMKRIDLLFLEVRVLIVATGIATMAALFAGAGLVWLSYGAFQALAQPLSVAAAATVVGIIDVLLGVAIGIAARRHWRSMDGASP